MVVTADGEKVEILYTIVAPQPGPRPGVRRTQAPQWSQFSAHAVLSVAHTHRRTRQRRAMPILRDYALHVWHCYALCLILYGVRAGRPRGQGTRWEMCFIHGLWRTTRDARTSRTCPEPVCCKHSHTTKLTPRHRMRIHDRSDHRQNQKTVKPYVCTVLWPGLACGVLSSTNIYSQ